MAATDKNRKPADAAKPQPGTTKRIFGYIFQYKWRVHRGGVHLGRCRGAGRFALFLQSLIDTYILPMVGASELLTGRRCCGRSA